MPACPPGQWLPALQPHGRQLSHFPNRSVLQTILVNLVARRFRKVVTVVCERIAVTVETTMPTPLPADLFEIQFIQAWSSGDSFCLRNNERKGAVRAGAAQKYISKQDSTLWICHK